MGKRVLVVDDDSVIREHLDNVLTHAGFDVVSVSSGDGAMDHLGRRGFDLLLLDVAIALST